MKAFRKCFVFLMIALGFSVQCFAVQAQVNNDQSQICDNYYVQPGGVYVAPDGIYLWIDGQLAQVDMLFSDERGVFVSYEEMNRRFVRCPHCGRWYDPERPQDHKCKGY